MSGAESFSDVSKASFARSVEDIPSLAMPHISCYSAPSGICGLWTLEIMLKDTR